MNNESCWKECRNCKHEKVLEHVSPCISCLRNPNNEDNYEPKLFFKGKNEVEIWF